MKQKEERTPYNFFQIRNIPTPTPPPSFAFNFRIIRNAFSTMMSHHRKEISFKFAHNFYISMLKIDFSFLYIPFSFRESCLHSLIFGFNVIFFSPFFLRELAVISLHPVSKHLFRCHFLVVNDSFYEIVLSTMESNESKSYLIRTFNLRIKPGPVLIIIVSIQIGAGLCD